MTDRPLTRALTLARALPCMISRMRCRSEAKEPGKVGSLLHDVVILVGGQHLLRGPQLRH